MRRVRNHRGFTLIELMVVVAIIGILVAIVVPLLANVSARARVAKAQADVRSIAAAVTIYTTHMGVLPPSIAAVAAPATNADGQTAGPFLPSVPTPPNAWTPYAYVPAADGTFTISTSGEGYNISMP